MKKTIIIGNWKMNLNVHDASLLVKKLDDTVPVHRNIEVVLAPSMLTIQPIARQIDQRKFKLAAQNAYFKDEGAYTGEVSFTMLRNVADYCIIGHSERRIYFHESLDEIRDKVSAAVRNGIKPILCIGESKQEREDNQTKIVIHDQLVSALSNITAGDIENMVIAYEPVWAISTFNGELAKPDQIKPVIKQIKLNISELYGVHTAENVRIIYGGSVDDQSASSYLEIDGVDGLLPGNASLNYIKFSKIVEQAYHRQND